jgi:hypothetical protein
MNSTIAAASMSALSQQDENTCFKLDKHDQLVWSTTHSTSRLMAKKP